MIIFDDDDWVAVEVGSTQKSSSGSRPSTLQHHCAHGRFSKCSPELVRAAQAALDRHQLEGSGSPLPHDRNADGTAAALVLKPRLAKHPAQQSSLPSLASWTE